MTIQISNLKYADPFNTLIDMDVAGVVDGQTIPFTYCPNDGEPLPLLIGQLLANGAYEIAAYEAPPQPVPASITRRQLLLALKTADIITPAEAVAAAQTGVAPAAVAAMFDTLNEPQKSDAYITWASMSVAERDNPLVAMLAASQNMDEAAVDDFFRSAAAL
ncbi:MAG: hypothetical protein AB7U62_03045 [Pseudolabrys sp.]